MSTIHPFQLSACTGLLSRIITRDFGRWGDGYHGILMMSNVFGAVEWSRIEGGGGVGGNVRMIECLAAKTS